MVCTDTFNMASRDEDNILDQIYALQTISILEFVRARPLRKKNFFI